jgi:opacity protein-like surface antigen
MEVFVANRSQFVAWRALAVLVALFSGVGAGSAAAQGYISPTAGYNFGGDSGCLTATNCEDKNWNIGGSLGTLGSVAGFEVELTYENNFAGSNASQHTSVLTLMGDLMLAPKISIVQPYGLIGLGLLRTAFTPAVGSDQSDNNIGWNIGGGLIIYVNPHVGLKGDVRYYHAFDALSLLGFDLARDQNKLDFGRVGLGLVLKF